MIAHTPYLTISAFDPFDIPGLSRLLNGRLLDVIRETFNFSDSILNFSPRIGFATDELGHITTAVLGVDLGLVELSINLDGVNAHALMDALTSGTEENSPREVLNEVLDIMPTEAIEALRESIPQELWDNLPQDGVIVKSGV
ncbi:MAG: hypothetical protein COB39_13800 [Marinosulfonomonas sp.]|nr:MAG: hypothetical protein COB39_13800 [Marinosulfonomonas sp.]